MEQPLSSIVYKGSIIEAITEAKHHKKLFVVYLSGADGKSNQLETSTWLDPRVAESLSKYCILLHVIEGSNDAANFSALYPQKDAPCITAIGYNGVQLWQHGGIVSADNLASSLEKAWLSLHVQETTAALLTAALASKKEHVPGDSASSEVGSSSSTQVSLAQGETQIQSQMSTPSNNSHIVEDGEDHGHAATEMDSSAVDMVSHASAERIGESNESIAPITIEEKALDLVEVDSTKTEDESSMSKENQNSLVVDMASHASAERIVESNESISPIKVAEKALDPVEVDSTKTEDELSISKENPNMHDQGVDRNEEAHRDIAKKARKGPKINRAEDAASEKTNFSDTPCNTSNDVYLNIRLPDGSSLQVKFFVMDTLRMIKDYVDRNQSSSFGSYDLAVPYPRKVFGDEDLDRTLSDLGLQNRQALIIVLRNKVNSTSLRGQSSSTESNPSVSGGDGGYLALIGRLFSYVNPFSYLGGSSDTAQDSQNSMWEYGPNHTPQNNQTPPTTTTNNRSRNPASSRFGSNIHTLRRDEDTNRFSDKNTFWNGNSTQFGGDDKSK